MSQAPAAPRRPIFDPFAYGCPAPKRTVQRQQSSAPQNVSNIHQQPSTVLAPPKGNRPESEQLDKHQRHGTLKLTTGTSKCKGRDLSSTGRTVPAANDSASEFRQDRQAGPHTSDPNSKSALQTAPKPAQKDIFQTQLKGQAPPTEIDTMTQQETEQKPSPPPTSAVTKPAVKANFDATKASSVAVSKSRDPETCQTVGSSPEVDESFQRHAINKALATKAPENSTRSKNEIPNLEAKIGPYQFYKKENETPAQVIERLKSQLLRQINTANRNKALRGEQITTGLSTLDMLRRDIAAGSNSSGAKYADKDVSSGARLQAAAGGIPGVADPTSDNLVDSQNPKQCPSSKEILPKNKPVTPAPIVSASTSSLLAYHSTSKVDTCNIDTKPNIPSQEALDSPPQWVSGENQHSLSASAGYGANVANLQAGKTSSTDSLRVMGMPPRPPAQDPEQGLVAWDGSMIPPPADWDQRRRFTSWDPVKLSSIDNWSSRVVGMTFATNQTGTVCTKVYPAEVLSNPALHADGIGFSDRDTMVVRDTATRFGYQLKDPGENIMEGQIRPDYDLDCKVDVSYCENAEHKDERPQDLIDAAMNRLRLNNVREEYIRPPHAEAPSKNAGLPAPVNVVDRIDEDHSFKETKPKVSANVYLRPANVRDIPQLTAILNHYIANSARPCELHSSTDAEMQARFDMVVQANLPFIVAIERMRKNAKGKAPHGAPNTYHPTHTGETVLGWAYAVDWTSHEYAEAITAELELYVRADQRDKGVGTCLLDALLVATDKGYTSKGGYRMHCADEVSYIYKSGGLRFSHKLMFTVRVFNKPVSPERHWRILRASRVAANYGIEPENEIVPNFGADAKIMDREDDYDLWLRDWLQRWGFEEEARLTRMGSREGRYVDALILSRETNWRPMDGCVPCGFII